LTRSGLAGIKREKPREFAETDKALAIAYGDASHSVVDKHNEITGFSRQCDNLYLSERLQHYYLILR
jgi:hypothetical protein